MCVSGLFVFAVMLKQARAAEERHGRPIEFSDPKGSAISTNFNRLDFRRGEFRDLEEDLTKFLPHTFSPKTSLDGIEAPALRTPANQAIVKKQKEARDRRVNWVWQNPTELTSGPTAEELFKVPEYGSDGREKKKSSASVESAYERLEREHRLDGDSNRDDDPTHLARSSASADDQKSEPDHSSPEQVSTGERALRRLFDSEPAAHAAAADSGHTSATDIFGLGNSAPTASPQQLESQRILRDQFNSLFAPSPASGGLTELQNSLSGISDYRSAVTQLEPLPSAAKSGFEPTLGTISMPFTGSGLPELTPKDLSPSWSTPTAPTRPELFKFQTSPSDFIPRRVFQ